MNPPNTEGSVNERGLEPWEDTAPSRRSDSSSNTTGGSHDAQR
ncbi:MAG TPA: hypothetical protein VFT59_05495 [Candidatus Saccharimonadales bacterium]|nr:hypothetical protein [Candidatus Saccharimonadales bacterium]